MFSLGFSNFNNWWSYLRLLIWCFILVGSAMFGATFNLVTRGTTIIFGTVKDNNLKINSSPIKYGCSYKKRLSKGRQFFVKNGFKDLGFCPKPQNCVHFLTTRFGSNFASMRSKYISDNGETLEVQRQHLQR